MESTPHPQSRWNWKWKACSALAVWAIVVVGLHLHQRWNVEVYYEEMRAQGLPTNSKELQEFYRVPEGVTDSTQVWIPVLEEASNAMGDNLALGHSLRPIQNEIPEIGLPWEHFSTAEDYLQKLAPQIQTIHRATEIGGQARFPDSCGHHRDVAMLLELQSAVAVRNGESALTLKSVRAILAIANAKRGQPDLVALMNSEGIREVGIQAMERWLPHCQWADADLVSLQRLICEIDYRKEFQNALAGNCLADMDGLDEEGRFPFRTVNLKEYLQQYSDARKELDLPWHDMISRFHQLDSRIEALKSNRMAIWNRSAFVKYAPPLEKLGQVMAISAARQACTNVGLAAQRYRLRHGHLPKSLGQIEPDLFGKSLEGTVSLSDPFDGQPLRFNLHERHLVIYSVGTNQIDEGGVKVNYPDRYQDIGFNIPQ